MIRMPKAPTMRSVVLCPVLLAVANAAANPINPSATNGSVGVQGLHTPTVTVTNTPGAVINWQAFSIGAGEVTRFNQQSASSSVLNRVLGPNISSIQGLLSSNGRVFLVNPNGILFSSGARIDTASFTATTNSLSDASFLAGGSGASGMGSFFNVEGPMTVGGTLSITQSAVELTGIPDSPGSITINTAQSSGVGFGTAVVALTSPLNTSTVIVTSGGAGTWSLSPTHPAISNLTVNSFVTTSGGQISITTASGVGPGIGASVLTTLGKIANMGSSVTLSGMSVANTASPAVTRVSIGSGAVTPAITPASTITAGATAPSIATGTAAGSLSASVATGFSSSKPALSTSAVHIAAANTAAPGVGTAALAGSAAGLTPTSAPTVSTVRPAAVATISLQKREPLF